MDIPCNVQTVFLSLNAVLLTLLISQFFLFQIAALVAENENLKVKLQGQISSESAAREVKELERQLNSAKEELFAEQKSSREKLESIEEVLMTNEWPYLSFCFCKFSIKFLWQ